MFCEDIRDADLGGFPCRVSAGLDPLAGVERLLATGELSRQTVSAFGDGANWYETADEITEALRGSIDASSNVLVKGSRSMRMGRVVRAIQQQAKTAVGS